MLYGPLFADSEIVYVPATVEMLPVKVPVPLPLSTNVTPVGKVESTEKLGFGELVADTVNVLRTPCVHVVVAALVNVGSESTLRVNDCVGAVPTLLLALNVNE